MTVVRIRRMEGNAALDLHRRMEQVMDALVRRFEPAVPSAAWAPRVDIYETGEAIVLALELPGVDRNDIEVLVQGRYLRVAGVRRGPSDTGCMRWHQMEIAYGPFERIVALPSDVDPDGVRATYTDGFLRIEVPLGQPQPRSVPIEAS